MQPEWKGAATVTAVSSGSQSIAVRSWQAHHGQCAILDRLAMRLGGWLHVLGWYGHGVTLRLLTRCRTKIRTPKDEVKVAPHCNAASTRIAHSRNMYNKPQIISIVTAYFAIVNTTLLSIQVHSSTHFTIMSSCGSFAMHSSYGSNSTLLQQTNCCASSRYYSQRLHLPSLLHSIHMPKRFSTSRSDSSSSSSSATSTH